MVGGSESFQQDLERPAREILSQGTCSCTIMFTLVRKLYCRSTFTCVAILSKFTRKLLMYMIIALLACDRSVGSLHVHWY